MTTALFYSTSTASVQQNKRKAQHISETDRIQWAADRARSKRQQAEHEEKCPEFGKCTLHGWTDW